MEIILESKVKALEALISYKKSGSCLCSNSTKFEDRILSLAKQIEEAKFEIKMYKSPREKELAHAQSETIRKRR